MKKLKRLKEDLMFLLLIVPIFIFLFSGIAYADTWAKTYGGINLDGARSIRQTLDGGYIVVGYTYPLGDNYPPDVWVLKLKSEGNIEWQKTYGGSSADGAFSIEQTSDGGYIVAGYTDSSGAGGVDAWVLKLDPNGNIRWQKTYGGSGHDSFNSIQQTSDGGYIVSGETRPFGGEREPDAWVLKLDPNGNIRWQKNYDGFFRELGVHSILQTPDGGYIILTDYPSGPLLSKLDAEGNSEWHKIYSYPYSREVKSIQQTQDGGYILLLRIWFDNNNIDAWILKLDRSGNIEWQKAYGGSNFDCPHSIQQTTDGGFIVTGETWSFGAGWVDGWVLKLDSSGNIEWQKTYGGSGYDGTYSIQQTTDGGHIVAGEGCSFGGPGCDVWVLKLDSYGNISGCPAGLIRDSNATVINTNAIISTIPIIVKNTAASPMVSNALVVNTNVIPGEVCIADITPPVVTITATPNILWPPNHKMVDVRIDGSATDEMSGIASVVITVTDEYGIYNMVVPQFGSTIRLEAWREGTDKDGRHYTITVVATDNAGNQSTATSEVIVPHDMRN